jgi:phosphoribosylamine-glycine ligase
MLCCVSLKQRITAAVASVDEDMLRSVWTELHYRIDIGCVTKGSNIEHL